MLNFFYLDKKKNQKLSFYLQNYYGLGSLSVKLICKTLGYDINIRIAQLSETDWDKLQSIIKTKYRFLLDDEVKKITFDNIQNMKNMKCYRGARHFFGLPANNRRTKSNAKTIGWR